MPLRSSIQRKPLSDETREAASEEDVVTADPEGDLASERYTSHASSEEFLTSLRKRI